MKGSNNLIKTLLSRKKKVRQILFSIALIYVIVIVLFKNSRISLNYLQKTRNLGIKLPTTSFSNGTPLNLKYINVNSNNEIDDLRKQLAFTFPYEPEKPIPRNVWQTWKCNRDSSKFPSSFKKLSDKWMEESKASQYNYNLIPDDYLETFLTNIYGEVPLIIDAFNIMPVNILKADFLRYLILYARGGIYSDMDTVPLKPLNSWPSVNSSYISNLKDISDGIEYKNKDTSAKINQLEPGFVVGIEADPDREDWSDWYARRIQFCQWTIQSKPGHPILRELILNITATTLNSVDLESVSSGTDLKLISTSDSKQIKKMIGNNKELDYNVNYRDKRRNDESYQHSKLKNKKIVDGTDIMNWTGPGIFSDIIFGYMNNIIDNNKDISLVNGNLISNNYLQSLQQSDEERAQTTKKFYKEITESLLNDNHIPWSFFSLIQIPVLVDDVMVLPITSFSPDVGQMGARDSSHPLAYVKHMFSGSWKDSADKNAGH
ncbi:hypothetical protein TPHA_0K01810 [Tetrapisispora phaffii CBS 4417]|uniref:Initiation-specific alpha-1,6-mannosyltransferase n=1 Tax=Tetrapisispora phaffii (strain ATCC 24235 / CBS 4417 / NBRC 1672 / NRRL Y-8282 / UCD 70-5) TaxID=1071381 RepID=G8BZI5_TETPH|nr:hypothetical protein TPHA_0K01810 [Tetrapisispora phaffii CBS 4417]CCE65313.1 hypothetical protein TPHA_0K01810 [Tetrapisispora phaffii CBS 4417]